MLKILRIWGDDFEYKRTMGGDDFKLKGKWGGFGGGGPHLKKSP